MRTKNLFPFSFSLPHFWGTIFKNITKNKKETHMDKTNSYTTPDPRDVNLKISNPKTIKKTKKTPCDVLYNRKNSASPDATDPPVPNRAHTEM